MVDNNFQLRLPDFLLTKLHCSKCQCYLSIPPISGTKGYYQCGRCAPNGTNNDLFEELARYAEFPCSNRGCEQKLKWANVRNHEKQCPFKAIDCLFPECMDRTTFKSIKNHFEMLHENYTHYEQLRSISVRLKDVGQCRDYVHLLVHKNTMFILFVRLNHYFEGNNLRYACSAGLFSLAPPGSRATSQDNTNTSKYNIILRVCSTTDEMTVQKGNESTLFDENTHCFQCLDGACTIEGHSNHTDFLPVKFSNLDHRNNSHLSYVLQINNPDEKNDKKGSAAGAQTLECPVCNLYMCRPIFNCPKGHSICNNCRRQVNVCPYCKTQMGDSRNYALEGLAESLDLPCLNASMGCAFVGTAFVMNDHMSKCNL